jgi:hypothetical protein
MDGVSRPQGRGSAFGHRQEEFIADVYLTAKRTLMEPTEWAVFRFHHLYGADWKLCCAKLSIDRGTFYHTVYRIAEKLGLVFLDLRPYALYPVDEYFQATTRRVDVRPFPACKDAPRYHPLRPPLCPAPAPVACALRPVPVPAPIDITDAAAVARHLRKLFRAGRTLRSISQVLNSLGVPAPNGADRWVGTHAKRLMLTAPCEPAQRLRPRKVA